MAQVGSLVARTLGGIFRADSGISFAVGLVAAQEGLTADALPVAKVVERNVAPDTLEKQIGAQYPSLHIYCEGLKNSLREKFTTFSGTARMAIDVRVTGDRIEALEDQMRLYVDAATQVLDLNRGDWGSGLFYTGGYEVAFSSVKAGGKNYLQTAKIAFDVQVSVN